MTSPNTAQVAQPRCRGQPANGDHPPTRSPTCSEGNTMIRTIVTAIAASALVLLGTGAAQADPIAAQCARATIPTALCNGTGGTAPTNDGNGQYVKAQPAEKYLSGSTPTVIGYQPVLNTDGTPKIGDDGKPVMDPIMGQTPVYSTKTADEDGKPARSGDGTAVDYSGYQYK